MPPVDRTWTSTPPRPGKRTDYARKNGEREKKKKKAYSLDAHVFEREKCVTEM